MLFLERDSKLESLEKDNLWDDSVLYCLNNWQNDISNKNLLLRAMTQTWYMCAYRDQMADATSCKDKTTWDELNMHYEIWMPILHETLKYGDSHYLDDMVYLCLSGYMLELWPFFFGDSGENINVSSENGIKRQRIAFQSDNEGARLFANVLLNHKNVSEQYLNLMFPGKSCVDEHFKWLVAVKCRTI